MYSITDIDRTNISVAAPLISKELHFRLTNAVLWALPMDIAPQFAGTAGGMMNTGFGVAGMGSPIVTGWLIIATGLWQLPFAVTATLLLVGALVALMIYPARRVIAQTGAGPQEAPLPALAGR